MRRNYLFLAMCFLLAMICGCGGSSSKLADGIAANPDVLIGTAIQDEVFQAALPMDGAFNATRTPAISSLAMAGAQYWSNSANVSQSGEAAQFLPPGDTLEYGIWKFYGTPDDSLGSIKVSLATGASEASYWVGIADYSSGHWDWLGQITDGADGQLNVNGAAGQHSSPAGHIYVAVLAEGDAAFNIDAVSIEYLQRFDVSGVVLDMEDQPIAGALVTTNLEDPGEVHTGEDGSFTLNGMPNGNWSVMVAMDGYQFYPDTADVAVNNANVTGVELRGNPLTSGFIADEANEPNNDFLNATQVSGDTVQGSISVLDDPEDFYGFSVPSAGFYYFQFVGDDSILFPTLEIFVDHEVESLVSTYSVVKGATWVGYYFQRQGGYAVNVRCEGGGGNFEISLHSGKTAGFMAYLGDEGDAGDGGDGLYEEMTSSKLDLEFPEFTCRLTSDGSGYVNADFVPLLAATVRPVDTRYTFTPDHFDVDFSAGDVTDLDFDLNVDAPTDGMEPNDDFAEATEITLPMAEPLAGWVGGYDATDSDHLEYFKFEVQEGKHVMVHVRFPEHSPNQFVVSGELNIYTGSLGGVSTSDYSQFDFHHRSRDPLSAGTYYAELYMEGALVPYTIEIAEFDAHYLSAYYELDGVPVSDCTMNIQTADQADTMDEASATDGIAASDMPLMPGDRLFVFHERFGMEFEPAYEWVEISDSDVQLTPQLSLTDDLLEPNDNWAEPADVELPFSIQASIDRDTDLADVYKFPVDSPGTYLFKLTLQDEDVELLTYLRESPSAAILLQKNLRGTETFYFRFEAAGDYMLEFRANGGGASRYMLDITEDETEVYSISGSLDSGVASDGNSGTYMVNHTTGEQRLVNNSSYLFGYYPDGTYQIEWMIANRDVTPSGPTSVVISGSDVVQDFTAVYHDYDSFEPNNLTFEAASITIPISVNATTDYRDTNRDPTYDSTDYFSFVATTDGVFEVNLVPKVGYPVDYTVDLREASVNNEVNFGKLSPAGTRRMLRWNLISGETYYIKVHCSADMVYTLSGDYLP